ncbi:3499_t:CDS:2 [Diversispora eburnea]|uniref:3499_t:CDS:1 n=1 Tax=Diversispora eburnea TaxID=1213867 RepID=A0A9N9C823_9GLOM|nr:3499_t:CDS:2 [Diversispora eburnea]
MHTKALPSIRFLLDPPTDYESPDTIKSEISFEGYGTKTSRTPPQLRSSQEEENDHHYYMTPAYQNITTSSLPPPIQQPSLHQQFSVFTPFEKQSQKSPQIIPNIDINTSNNTLPPIEIKCENPLPSIEIKQIKREHSLSPLEIKLQSNMRRHLRVHRMGRPVKKIRYDGEVEGVKMNKLKNHLFDAYLD